MPICLGFSPWLIIKVLKEVSVYFQLRGGRYSFVYYDRTLKKNIRLSSSETSSIASPDAAQKFCDAWNSEHRTSDIIIEEKLQWIETHPQFVDLVRIYELSRKEDAKYSWQTALYYLRYYVFPFFLTDKKEADINQWRLYFEDFRDYLKSAPSIKKMNAQEILSLSTANGVIKSLNAFLMTMFRRNKLTHISKCRMFAKSLLNVKGEESVIDHTSFSMLYNSLVRRSPTSADMFLTGVRTGLRLNELSGLSLADFFPGFPPSEALRIALDPLSLKIFGFLSLESQPELTPLPRDNYGLVPRKPLKGKKRISSANSRTIPIFDLDCFNTLVRLWNEQQSLFQCEKYGNNPSDYLLFKGTSTNIYYRHMIEAQETWGKKPFTPHDTRHTYSTWLAERTGGNFTLCKMILGHSSLDITMQYVHMGARIHKDLKSKMQLERPMVFATNDSQGALIFPEQYGKQFGSKMGLWKS